MHSRCLGAPSSAAGQGNAAFERCIHNTPKVNNFPLGKENKKPKLLISGLTMSPEVPLAVEGAGAAQG